MYVKQFFSSEDSGEIYQLDRNVEFPTKENIMKDRFMSEDFSPGTILSQTWFAKVFCFCFKDKMCM